MVEFKSKYWFEICDILSKHEFNYKSKGYYYWDFAINYVIENGINFKMEEIYNIIARKNNDTRQKVERAMRTAKKSQYGKGNKELLRLIVFEVLEEWRKNNG